MEVMKPVKGIIDWNPIGLRSMGWPNKKLRNEGINGLKMLNPRNWCQVVKDRKAWIDVVQKTNKV
jgi:hypothetical protein